MNNFAIILLYLFQSEPKCRDEEVGLCSFSFFSSFRALNEIFLAVLGRGKVHHKGRRRHFTDAEELKMEMEREKRRQEWRVNWFNIVIYTFYSQNSL